MTNVSIDWIALKKGLVLFGLLGDVEHASRVACQVPNRRVARREGICGAHQNVETKL